MTIPPLTLYPMPDDRFATLDAILELLPDGSSLELVITAIELAPSASSSGWGFVAEAFNARAAHDLYAVCGVFGLRPIPATLSVR